LRCDRISKLFFLVASLDRATAAEKVEYQPEMGVVASLSLLSLDATGSDKPAWLSG
jgi:hypothetical protein